jgi:hypothetical protein
VSTSVPLIQQAPIPLVKLEGVAKATWKVVNKDNDSISDVCQVVGKKPRKIKIKVGGDTYGHCDGKNAWDEAVKTLIPRILDVSVLSWEGHALDSF